MMYYLAGERAGGGRREPAAALAVAVCGMLSAIHYTDMCLAHAGLLSVFGPPGPLLGLSSVCFRLPQNSVGVCVSECVCEWLGEWLGEKDEPLNASINFNGMPFNQYFLLVFFFFCGILQFCIFPRRGKSASARCSPD